MKQFKVRLWVGSSQTEVIVAATNSANAQYIARILYPNGRIVTAREL